METMEDCAIILRGVKKSFGKHEVLKGVDVQVPTKSIYAFLGNNGEGKSTAIRLIVGLMQADSGAIQVLGRDIHTERTAILSEVGCIVDAPSAYANLTAQEFLKIPCLLQNLPSKEIDRVLEVVGLRPEKKQLIATFSLGMKKRLALGNALIGRPKLLILDEPTNGLDPSGILELRTLIASLPSLAGCTVFVSSHQLDEVEKIATHVALLRNGRVQHQSTLAEIYANQATALDLHVDNARFAERVLQSHAFDSVFINDQQVRVSNISHEQAMLVNACLVRANVGLKQAIFKKPSLEQWFAGRTLEGVSC